MEQEIWKHVKDHPSYYVSNFGNAKRLRVLKDGTTKLINLKLINRIGYSTIAIATLKTKNKKVSVHRLVAEAFIPNPENKPTVNHKNAIRNDNTVCNLEWVSYSENTLHAYQTGLLISKLSNKDIMDIKHRRNLSESLLSIAKFYNVSTSHICNIVRKKYRNFI
jgi:hypothetical protein